MKKPRTSQQKKQNKRARPVGPAAKQRARRAPAAAPLSAAGAAAARPPGWHVSAMAVARARATPRRGRGALPVQEVNLFKPAEPHPLLKQAMQAAGYGQQLMAMDDSLSASAAWASSYFGSAVAEGVTFMGYPLLAEMAQRPEYRVITEVIAEEMTRKWIRLRVDGEATQAAKPAKPGKSAPKPDADGIVPVEPDAEEDNAVPALSEGAPDPAAVAQQQVANEKAEKLKQLETEMKRLDVQGAFLKIAQQDGFFGRAHLYIDTGDGDNAQELKLSIGDGSPGDGISKRKFRKGKLVALRAVEAVWTYPIGYNSNDPLSSSWYEPQTWFVMGKEVHVTRLLKFVGREVPDLLKPAYSFGGLSMSQMAKPYVDNWLNTRQSVADLIRSFTVFGLKTDLQSANLQSDGQKLYDRIALFNALRDNQGLMVMNKDSEELDNVSVPLGTLDVLQAQTQEHMAAVSRIPLVKLLGVQPAGLNASSDGEIRVFYDTVHAQQKRLFDKHLRTVINFIQLSLWGQVDPAITYDWAPLWSLDEKAEAEKRKAEADTHAIYFEMGAVDGPEVRQTLANDPDSAYAGLDLSKPIEPPEQEQNEDNLFDADTEDPEEGLRRILNRGARPAGGESGDNRSGGGMRTSDRTGGKGQND